MVVGRGKKVPARNFRRWWAAHVRGILLGFNTLIFHKF
jgi:hypothetical protein